MTHLVYAIEQEAFRFYGDGTESGSTPLAVQGTDIDKVPSETFQLRVRMNESGGEAGGGSLFQLQVEKNATGGFVDVTGASSNVQAVAGGMTDDEVTTERLTGGATSFVQGRVDEADGNTTTAVDTTANNFTEIVYSLTIVDGDVANADTLDFQLLDDMDGNVTYTVVPRVTVQKAATFQQTIAATTNHTATVSKTVTHFRAIAAVTAHVAALAKIATHYRAIAAATSHVATMANALLTSVAIAAATAHVASLARTITFARSIAATTAHVATIATAATFSRSIAAVTANVATVAKAATFYRTVAAVTSHVATVTPATLALVTINAVTAHVASIADVFILGPVRLAWARTVLRKVLRKVLRYVMRI